MYFVIQTFKSIQIRVVKIHKNMFLFLKMFLDRYLKKFIFKNVCNIQDND